MIDQATAIVALAVSVISAGFLYFIKSPKQINGELAAAIRSVTTDHELLARRFERHDEAVKGLTKAVDRLTERIDRIEPHLARKPNGRRGD